MIWRSDKPIFMQVVDLFKKDVVCGLYKANQKILSVREYALKLDLNPNTIVKVYDVLSKEGIIEARATAGYFITSNMDLLNSLKPKFAKAYCQEFLASMAGINISKEEAISILKECD